MVSIFIVAAEASGDELGAKLVKSLTEARPKLKILGIGGQAMQREGIPSLMDISGLSILGFVEGLKHYPMIMQRVTACANEIMKSGAEAVVLIDSWGFMVRVAKRLRAQGYEGKIIKFVAPQVWAMRAGRAKILAKHVDLLLSIQPMDAPYFEAEGLETHYVGNPIFDMDYSVGSSEIFRTKHNLDDRPIVSIWFGSRLSEAEQLTSIFCATVTALRFEYPELAFVAPLSKSIAQDVKSRVEAFGNIHDFIFVSESDKLGAMAASTAALACSGTVTSQLASVGVPTVVAYRLNALTHWVAKRLFKPDYISIVNIVAGQPLMPEYIQNEANGSNLSTALMQYLQDEDAQKRASEALIDQTRKMGAVSGQKASEKAARIILTALKLY